MSTIKITYDSSSQFCFLDFHKNVFFHNFVRYSLTPTSYRQWNTRKRGWEIHISKLAQVVAVAKKYFECVDYSSLPESMQIELVAKLSVFKEASVPPKESSVPLAKSITPYNVLYLLPNAPMEVVRAAYKALAFMSHPDKGGDPEVFKKITKAFEEIEAQVS